MKTLKELLKLGQVSINKKKLMSLLLLTVIAHNCLAYASLITLSSYDKLPLTPTWKEIDLTYWGAPINGKRYQDNIKLLRPTSYLIQHHINKIGDHIYIDLPEFGLKHTKATITHIKLSPFHLKSCKEKTCSYVISFFTHHTNNIRTYKFKDMATGKISILHATPNHQFYVKNLDRFISISQVNHNDLLVGNHNHLMKLICKHTIQNCGIPNNKAIQIVYNIEVYHQHIYRVGSGKILVHNGCGGGPGGPNSPTSSTTPLNPSAEESASSTPAQIISDQNLSPTPNNSRLIIQTNDQLRTNIISNKMTNTPAENISNTASGTTAQTISSTVVSTAADSENLQSITTSPIRYADNLTDNASMVNGIDAQNITPYVANRIAENFMNNNRLLTQYTENQITKRVLIKVAGTVLGIAAVTIPSAIVTVNELKK